MLTDNVIALSFLMTDARTSQTGLQQSCVNWFRHHPQVRVQPPLHFIYSFPKRLLMQKATANLGICITIKQPYFYTEQFYFAVAIGPVVM